MTHFNKQFASYRSALLRAFAVITFLAISMLATLPEVSQAQCHCTFTFAQIAQPPVHPDCGDPGTQCVGCNCSWFEFTNTGDESCCMNEIDVNGPDQIDCFTVCCWYKDISNPTKTWISNPPFPLGCAPTSQAVLTPDLKAGEPPCSEPLPDLSCKVQIKLCVANHGTWTFTFHYTDGSTCTQTVTL